MIKATSNKKEDYIKDLHTVIFTGPTSCRKSHLVEYNKHFDYIIIIFPSLQWNRAYHAIGLTRHDDNVCLPEPEEKLYKWMEKLPLLLGRPEALFIIDNIVADESPMITEDDNRRQSLLK